VHHYKALVAVGTGSIRFSASKNRKGRRWKRGWISVVITQNYSNFYVHVTLMHLLTVCLLDIACVQDLSLALSQLKLLYGKFIRAMVQ